MELGQIEYQVTQKQIALQNNWNKPQEGIQQFEFTNHDPVKNTVLN